MPGMKAQLTGLDGVTARMDGLRNAVQTRIVRAGVTEGLKVLKRAAKARTPKRYGFLRKSLAQKVKTYRGTGVTVGMVGPKLGSKVCVGTYTRGKRKGQQKYADPNKYMHLVEFGHGRARAFAPLRGALAETRNEVELAVAGRISAGIDKAVAA